MGNKLVIPAMAAGFVSLMGRIAVTSAPGPGLDLPEGQVNIGGNGKGYLLEAQSGWSPLDVASNDGTVSGGLNLGDDVYIYAVQHESGIAQWIASQNSTYPDGYTADNSRKIGGFHVGLYRPIEEAYNASYNAFHAVLPNSCWDLQHRPTCDPTGMVEVIEGALWADVYLASEGPGAWPNTVPVSQHSATPLTGTEGYSRLDYARLARNAGKRLPDYQEFMVLAYGVPQGATGASARQDTGDHSGYGFNAVSCMNVDQPAGNVYQLSNMYYDRDSTGDAWYDDLNQGKDSAFDHGQWRGGQLRVALFGGNWTVASEAGSRCVHLVSTPWDVSSPVGVRAVCDSL
ncbi:hypothetical protein E4656_13835 [Natronospirillum operosum]|uniref:Major tropism determinant second domain-containing protein n=1 Tax=Natronospirillum operosum TaxID=2759953 RepID=A0A4Z0WCF2_9GAMM|nr:hypothetical protein [Natronospirillum operosum]TGG92545.1 hypothetical protein E4656_13835 [Natronospirillum operosum]